MGDPGGNRVALARLKHHVRPALDLHDDRALQNVSALFAGMGVTPDCGACRQVSRADDRFLRGSGDVLPLQDLPLDLRRPTAIAASAEPSTSAFDQTFML
jgi:hypothetical protein